MAYSSGCLDVRPPKTVGCQDPNEDLGLGFPYDTFLGESRPARQEATNGPIKERTNNEWGGTKGW